MDSTVEKRPEGIERHIEPSQRDARNRDAWRSMIH